MGDRYFLLVKMSEDITLSDGRKYHVDASQAYQIPKEKIEEVLALVDQDKKIDIKKDKADILAMRKADAEKPVVYVEPTIEDYKNMYAGIQQQAEEYIAKIAELGTKKDLLAIKSDYENKQAEIALQLDAKEAK